MYLAQTGNIKRLLLKELSSDGQYIKKKNMIYYINF